jgi:hypothetical protein
MGRTSFLRRIAQYLLHGDGLDRATASLKAGKDLEQRPRCIAGAPITIGSREQICKARCLTAYPRLNFFAKRNKTVQIIRKYLI